MRQRGLVVLVGCLLAGCSSSPVGPEAQPSSATSATEPSGTASEGTLPTGWRTEVWRDVQLEVPDAWALGYAPVPEGDGALLCGIGVRESTRHPYVGRPGYGSDMCQRVELDDLAMDGEGVWFGSRLPEGDVVSRTGLRQTTVPAGDTRVTVATFDEAVHEGILESVEVVQTDANGCPRQPRVDDRYPDEGYGDAQSLSVCLYEERLADGWERTWSAELPADAAPELVDRLDSAQPAGCRTKRSTDQLVLLRVRAEDPFGTALLRRDLLVHLGGCPTLEVVAEDRFVELTADLVRPWATGGIRTYVVGNGLPQALDRYFRPLWG